MSLINPPGPPRTGVEPGTNYKCGTYVLQSQYAGYHMPGLNHGSEAAPSIHWDFIDRGKLTAARYARQYGDYAERDIVQILKPHGIQTSCSVIW